MKSKNIIVPFFNLYSDLSRGQKKIFEAGLPKSNMFFRGSWAPANLVGGPHLVDEIDMRKQTIQYSVSCFPFANAAGGSGTGTIRLHGTSSVPIQAKAQVTGNTTAATAIWQWYGDNAAQSGIAWEGRMGRTNAQFSGDNAVKQYDLGNGWTTEQDNVTNNYYRKYTLVSATNYFNSNLPTFNTWTAFTTTTDSGASQAAIITNAPFSSPNPKFATLKIEIDTNGTGSNILGTGYYECYAIRV